MKKVVEAAESLRERKKARTREAIIDAALDLFEAKGYDATTVEDIAAAADVSPRTFFRYFESKLDLVMARSDTKRNDLGPRLAERPPSEDVIEATRAIFQAELEEQLRDPRVRREFQVMLTTPSLRHLAREHFHDEEAHLVGPVADRLGVPPTSLEARVATSMIASALWAAANCWIEEGGDLDRFGEVLDATFGMLADGVRRGPAS